MRLIFLTIVVFLIIFDIVYSLTEIIVTETEAVDLSPDVSDPDADKLIYKFSKPLDEKGRWQTRYGDAGIYNITITVSDGEAETSEDVTLTVTKKEVPPTIVKIEPNLDSIDLKEREQIKFIVESYDLNKDKLEYTWILDGSEVSKDTSIIFHPDYDDSGNYALVAKISDGTNLVSKEWKINVLNVDRPPEFLPISYITVNENEDVSIVLNATDPDGDAVSFEAKNIPEGASFDGNAFTWKPGYDTVVKDSLLDVIIDKYHLLSKSIWIDFIAKSNELSTLQRAIIKVKDVNRPPIFEDLEEIVVKEGDSFIIVPKAVDPDNDKISFRYSGWINSDSYKTNFEDAGKHGIKVVASDGEFLVTKDVNITVINVNRKPIFNPIRQADVIENTTLSVSLDATEPDGDNLFFYIDNTNNFTDLEIKGNTLTWNPGFDIAVKNPKDITFNVIASDGELNASQELRVKVNDFNRAPEIISTKPEINSFAYQGIPARFEVIANDPDNDKLTYEWKLGTFEEYKGKPALLRRFNELGRKKLSVVVSDGEKETEFEWDVHVIRKPISKR